MASIFERMKGWRDEPRLSAQVQSFLALEAFKAEPDSNSSDANLAAFAHFAVVHSGPWSLDDGYDIDGMRIIGPVESARTEKNNRPFDWDRDEDDPDKGGPAGSQDI